MKIEFILIKPENDFCSSVESLNSLLMSNSKVIISKNSLTFDGIATKYLSSTMLVRGKKERLFRITISNEDKDTEKCITALEKVSHILRKILKESNRDFKINTIWDEVAQHYCKLSYPLLNKIENQMRKLIFRFMIENIGSDWVEKSIPENVMESLRQNAERSKIKSLVENCLYEADFIHLLQFMFSPYSTSSIINLFEKLDNAKSLEDINELKAFRPKSNWDRYFSKLIKFDKLDEKWNELYSFRNKIAHNKLLLKSDYENLVKLSTEIGKCKVEVPDVAKEALRKVAFHSIESGIELGTHAPVLGFPNNSPYLSGIANSFSDLSLASHSFLTGAAASLSHLSLASDSALTDAAASLSHLSLASDSALTGAATSLRDLSLINPSIFGKETVSGIYSLAPTKTCPQCGKAYDSNALTPNFPNKCPECEKIGLVDSKEK
jgi:hypothetical protein